MVAMCCNVLQRLATSSTQLFPKPVVPTHRMPPWMPSTGCTSKVATLPRRPKQCCRSTRNQRRWWGAIDGPGNWFINVHGRLCVILNCGICCANRGMLLRQSLWWIPYQWNMVKKNQWYQGSLSSCRMASARVRSPTHTWPACRTMVSPLAKLAWHISLYLQGNIGKLLVDVEIILWMITGVYFWMRRRSVICFCSIVKWCW